MTGRRLAPDERRSAILGAARELFGERSFSDVSMADVAAAAGISPPLVVFYFGSKRALYLEILRGAVARIADGLRAVPGPPSLARLHASVRFYAEFAAEHRSGYLSYLRGGGDVTVPEAAALVEDLRTELTATISADVAAGLPDLDAAGRVELTLLARGHLGSVDALVTSWLALPEAERAQVGPDRLADLAVGAFTGALGALTGASASRSGSGPGSGSGSGSAAG